MVPLLVYFLSNTIVHSTPFSGSDAVNVSSPLPFLLVQCWLAPTPVGFSMVVSTDGSCLVNGSQLGHSFRSPTCLCTASGGALIVISRETSYLPSSTNIPTPAMPMTTSSTSSSVSFTVVHR